jgi:purine-cytosine permease-like protein
MASAISMIGGSLSRSFFLGLNSSCSCSTTLATFFFSFLGSFLATFFSFLGSFLAIWIFILLRSTN